MIIDTHSHLNFKAYNNDRDKAIERTQKEGVVCVDVGTKYETSQNAIKLAKKNENIYAAIGLHPIHIKSDLLKIKMDEEEGGFMPLGEEYDYEKYKQLIIDDRSGSNPRIVAVGEVGLDYYYKPKSATKKELFKQKQKEVFVKQLDLAEEMNLPVIVHCRVAYNDLYEILKVRKIRGVIHCFVGTPEEAQSLVDLGFYIGINGIIFKLDLDDVVRKVPLDKILLETDCPYLTPPKAGIERNEPIFVKYVAERIAELKNISAEEVIRQTIENTKKLFKI